VPRLKGALPFCVGDLDRYPIYYKIPPTRVCTQPVPRSIHPFCTAYPWQGNESVPKIIINSTINLLFKTAISILAISNRNSFRVLFDKIAFVYFGRKKYIYILALETASPGNRHCASCIGTLSFPVYTPGPRYMRHV